MRGIREAIIMRGLPGSGKTTWVEKFRKQLQDGSQALVCSADQFFTSPTGDYRFDPARISEAHDSCLKKFLVAVLHQNHDYLIADNTNLSAWEIAPYCRLAELYRIPVRIVRTECDFETAALRQEHGVPVSLLWRMHQTLLSERLPLHWKEEIVIRNPIDCFKEEIVIRNPIDCF